uniref:40S ribosomal protein S19 n=2 Tax=Meloidogyne floridensis TaxID=298350 RepID=A0A915NSS1_9BILA
MGKPTSVKDVDQHEIVDAISTFLKKGGKIKVPEWADLVKLGTNKELAPINPDWYYVRVASIARRLYILYGGNKRRGVRPNHFVLASGAVIRKSLQSLEAIKWVEKDARGGRKLSKQGQKDLDRIATQLRFGNEE